jgi:hypothetical protein
MLSLLWFLNSRKKINAFLISDKNNSLPQEFQKYIKSDIDQSLKKYQPDFIIRDMRDSSEEEITHLKKYGKVIVIDDLGNGRRIADKAIDLLPNPDQSKLNNGLSQSDAGFNNQNAFIFGYNFINAISGLNGKTIKKELNFAIYPGNDPDSGYADFLVSLLPDKSNYAILAGKNSCIVKEGKREGIPDFSYAEIILSSRAVISHFGITLYEGAISGCRLLTVNPTQYHSMLSDIAGGFLPLVNLGTVSGIDPVTARSRISEITAIPICTDIDSGDVYKKTISGLDAFFSKINVF